MPSGSVARLPAARGAGARAAAAASEDREGEPRHRDGRAPARAPLGARLPAGRAHARDGTARAASDGVGQGRALAAPRRPAEGFRARAGRPARRASRPEFRRQSRDLPELCRGSRQRPRRHLGRAREDRRRRQGARGLAGDLPAGAVLHRPEPLGLAARLRPLGRALRHARRALRPAGRGAEPSEPSRQDRPHQADRRRCRRQSEEARLGRGGLVDRPSQRAGRGPQPGDRRAVDRRARRPRRRRDTSRARG